jgi:hypothetical protein
MHEGTDFVKPRIFIPHMGESKNQPNEQDAKERYSV